MQGATAFRRERGGGQDRRADDLGEFLQAAGEVDRRTDDREVQPVARADIAELDLAPMQPDAESKRRLPPSPVPRP